MLYLYITPYLVAYLLSIYSIVELNKRGKELMAYSKAFANYLFLSRSFDVNKESLEIYEEHLPFVIAMGREKKWTKKFKDIFENVEYRSNFYADGESVHYDRIGAFQDMFSSTIASASLVSNSSSGDSSFGDSSFGDSSFGDDGFSGGGGGSSGGGGW